MLSKREYLSCYKLTIRSSEEDLLFAENLPSTSELALEHLHSLRTVSVTQPSTALGDLTTVTVAAVNFKLPEFWVADSELWFLTIKLTFRKNKITMSFTKFNLVISALPQSSVAVVRDILCGPLEDKPYEHLKNELIRPSSRNRHNNPLRHARVLAIAVSSPQRCPDLPKIHRPSPTQPDLYFRTHRRHPHLQRQRKIPRRAPTSALLSPRKLWNDRQLCKVHLRRRGPGFPRPSRGQSRHMAAGAVSRSHPRVSATPLKQRNSTRFSGS